MLTGPHPRSDSPRAGCGGARSRAQCVLVSLRRTQTIEIEPLVILATLAAFRRFHRRLERALEAP